MKNEDPSYDSRLIKKTTQISIAFISLVLLVAPAVFGANTETNEHYELTPVVVTAKGIEMSEREIPVSVGVVTVEKIKGRHIASLPDLLVMIPGVFRESDSPWGSEVNIRGLGRDSVVMLIDGVRLNTATDINSRFGLIDPWDTQRMEILKGPFSSIYGSGSLGGVVNILTRDADYSDEVRTLFGLSVMAESNPEGYSGRAYAGWSSPGTKVYILQTYRDYDSYKDGSGERVHNTQFRDNYTKIRLGHKLNDDFEVTANLQFYEGHEIGIPGTGTAPLPAVADVTYPITRRSMLSLTGSYDHNGDLFENSKLHVYYQEIDRRVRVDNFPASSPIVEMYPKADHKTYGALWTTLMSVGDQKITAGADVWQRRLENSHRRRILRNGSFQDDQPLPEATFTSSGVFVEDVWKISDRLTATAGARFDWIVLDNDETVHYKSDKNENPSWNMNAGVVAAITETLDFSVAVARGYRAPSLEERYQYIQLGGGGTRWGDPGLDPEESFFFEGGLRLNTESFDVSVTGFGNLLDDMIGDKMLNELDVINANIHRAEIFGVEAKTELRFLDHYALYGNVAYVSGRNTSEHEHLPYIPPVSGLFGFSAGNDSGVSAYLEGVFAFKQSQVPDGFDETPGWLTFDLGLSWKIKAKYEHSLYAGVKNILDKNYKNALTRHRGATYNEPGRSFTAGYEVTF
ncbi:MAG: TonB-dependent receptor [Lentisphaerae bacterium]|nr:TonB-dependent receptor [Lentisphaerota bacterium]